MALPTGSHKQAISLRKGTFKTPLSYLMKSPLWLVIGILFSSNAITGEEKKEREPAYEPARFFRTLILPILDKRCFECHSEREAWDDGGLVLDTKAGMMKGGDHGPAVVPFNTKKSSLIRTINADEYGNLMPPDERLPPKRSPC